MQTKQRFFSRILLPSLLAVLLFMAAIYLFVIPNYRESLMDGKRETIRELTNTSWSVIHKLNIMVNNNFTVEQAQKEAVLIIADMRYGEDFKDYFWITDTFPRMIMHPYRPQMNGTDLTNYRDPRGKNFFVDIVNVVKANGDGYVDYKWQWKDDSLTVVPKLSYVKAFEPWGWIVGTGIYIEDVNRQISNLTRKVVWISVFITILIGAVIIYLARRNYVAEIERQNAQDRLRDSMQRYKKLVEASTDGVLMVIENEIVYCNPFLLNLLGYSQGEFDQHNSFLFETLNGFTKVEEDISVSSNLKNSPEASAEHRVSKKNGQLVNVVVSRSKFDIDGKQGVICAVKDVSKHKDVERELDLSMEKFKSVANLLNLGIFRCTLGRNARFVEINQKGIELLGYSSQVDLVDTKVQELFEIVDEWKEVIQTIGEGLNVKERLLRLKRADGLTLSALVSLFPINDVHGKTLYYDGFLIDAYNYLGGSSSFSKNSSSLQLSTNELLNPLKDFVTPALQCSFETPVSVASKLMAKANADIILIVNHKAAVMGILTQSDISRRVVACGGNLATPVSEIMSAPVISVSDKEMIMDAFALMVQHKISYVVVKSDDNLRPSYISLQSLSVLRKDTPEFLVNSIVKAESIYEVADTMKQLPRLISNLVNTGTGVAATGKLISKISDTITEKIIIDAISQLGEPPVPFVFLTLGSEGRREQTLATDQDNAIIFEVDNADKVEIYREYFLKLGNSICSLLNTAGYPFCDGGVMAMNKEWCMSSSDWEKTIASWVTTPNSQEILNISIFFDFRPIYGDFEMANALQQFCLKMLKDKNVFFYNLAKSIINLKPSIIDSYSSGSFHIKMPLLVISSILRLWSLKYGVSERNTLERLSALQAVGAISVNLKEEFERAYSYLMLLRIKNQLRQIEANEKASNDIDSKYLADFDRIMLKKSISTISDHLNRLAIDFRVN
jgi:PAS domain S-box-containing protein